MNKDYEYFRCPRCNNIWGEPKCLKLQILWCPNCYQEMKRKNVILSRLEKKIEDVYTGNT